MEVVIPHLLPGENRCKARKPTGSMTFCSVAPATSSVTVSDTSGDVAVSARSKTQLNKNRCDKFSAPSDDESADVEEVNAVLSGWEEQSVAGDECVGHSPPVIKKSFAGRG